MRRNEYLQKGEYHKNLDPSWRYKPVYLEKMRFVKGFLQRRKKSEKIIDLGCGEGTLVEKFNKQGYDIRGIDYNYTSRYVKQGDITKLQEVNCSYDVVLCLDVVEHLTFAQQEKAFSEMSRILKKGGIALVSMPNLAHIACRPFFLLTGRLLRPSSVDRHRGERPICEYIEMAKRHGFSVIKRKGFFPTLPLISFVTWFFPSRALFLHKIENALFAYSNWCLLNVLVLRLNRKDMGVVGGVEAVG